LVDSVESMLMHGLANPKYSSALLLNIQIYEKKILC